MHDTYVETVLGKEVLLLHGMTGREALSQPFAFTVTLVSDVRKNQPIDQSKLLGTMVKVTLASEYSADPSLADKPTRYFNGYATQVVLQEDEVGNFRVYRVELRPWLWLLTKTTDCRIYQNKTVPQIVEQIFKDSGFTDFKLKLGGNYQAREYCVQYRESDLAFVSRLLEHEGIYYYFEFDADKHTLVLTDGTSPHEPRPKYETIDYGHTFAEEHTKETFGGRIARWRPRQELRAGQYASKDYDFTKSGTPLKARQNGPKPHPQSAFEQYDYPGGYVEASIGEKYASVRLQEEQMSYEMFEANAYSHGLAPGYVFTMAKYPVAAQNAKYLTVEAHYDFALNPYEASERLDVTPDVELNPGAADLKPRDYTCRFSALKVATAYRPPRVTPRPVIAGLQTAKVVGPKGEEIWTDKYGRIKVQFHWDREGRFDENSSCWIRTAQMWAGAGWGSQYVPRIGDEVVVSFLEGDPDQPLVTGSVYNGENSPPFALPDKMATSGVKSKSTKDGGRGYNELSFDDTTNKELVNFHAQKDLKSKVERDTQTSVGRDSKSSVDRNENTNVKKNRFTKIGGKDTQVVTGDQNIVVGSQYVTVTKTYALSAMVSAEIVCGATIIKITPAGISIVTPKMDIMAPSFQVLSAKAAILPTVMTIPLPPVVPPVPPTPPIPTIHPPPIPDVEV
jgi:type VI secretion system secreted protein VgrG